MTRHALEEAYAVGQRYEAGLDDAARRQGSHFTPPDVAELLVDRSLGLWTGDGAPVVCDPSCGGGVFLVAAAEALRRRGLDADRIVNDLVVGVDVDAGAVAASAAALHGWAAAHGGDGVEPRVLVGDALDPGLPARLGAVDVVVGNPPFRNQLGGATARSAAERAAMTTRFGAVASGYVDLATLFQLVGLDLVGEHGIVTLIVPRSFLVARDAAPVRRRVLDVARLRGVWFPGVSLFDANVDVCATSVERGPAVAGPIAVWGGRSGDVAHGWVDPASIAGAPTWSPLWAVAHGVPRAMAAPRARPIGSIASATAGFRDQYYGLLPHLREDEPTDGASLVTTAMIEPGRCDWGRRPVTIARTRRTTPWVDLAALATANAALSTWVTRLRVPKVLVATQTKVIEAVADPSGTAVPLTPVIAVVPSVGTHTARIAAALLAPAATAWALHRYGGAGMSAGALKLAASQVLDVPLPVDEPAWDAGVELIEGSSRTPETWRAFGRLMNTAWGLEDDELVDWWLDRFPRKFDRSGSGSIH